MLSAFDEALDIYQNDKPVWKKIKASAKRKRFTWKKSVDKYYEQLYKL